VAIQLRGAGDAIRRSVGPRWVGWARGAALVAMGAVVAWGAGGAIARGGGGAGIIVLAGIGAVGATFVA